MKCSEIQIIRDILNGESEKFRLLIHRYAPMVFIVVREFHSDEENTEEIAEKIFVEAYCKLCSYDKNLPFSGWLYSLAFNYLKNEETSKTGTNWKFEKQATSSDPDQENAKKGKINLIRKGLAYMVPEYSEAFLLRYYDKLSFDAMSKRLGVDASELKQRVHLARKELKKYMEEHPESSYHSNAAWFDLFPDAKID